MFPVEPPELPPVRLVAAVSDADEGPPPPPPVPPPRLAAPLELDTIPVWLSEDIEDCEDTDEVDLTVMLLRTPIDPAPDDPRRLRLPRRRGLVMLTYFSALVEPVRRTVRSMSPVSTGAVLNAVIAPPPPPPPPNPVCCCSCQRTTAAITATRAAMGIHFRLGRGRSGGGTISGRFAGRGTLGSGCCLCGSGIALSPAPGADSTTLGLSTSSIYRRYFIVRGYPLDRIVSTREEGAGKAVAPPPPETAKWLKPKVL
jgi:hypothetical protein